MADFSGLCLALQRSFRFRSERGGFGTWILHSALNPLLLHFFRMYIFWETLVLRSGFVALSNSLMEVVVETPLRHPNSLLAKNETLSLSF